MIGKGENAGNQHFLLFPSSFLHCEREKSIMWQLCLICYLQILSIWTSLYFYRPVKSESKQDILDVTSIATVVIFMFFTKCLHDFLGTLSK